jgi:prepilin-type N-terminal cleavage/methylation domain-containing protein
MKILTPSPQSGFSLIELLIVLVMIGILTTLSLMQLGESRVDFQRQRISREFKSYLERARFDSVKRRAQNPDGERCTNSPEPPATVEVWQSKFKVSLDFDGDGTLLPSETREVNFADRTDAIIKVSDSLAYPITIRFDCRGLVAARDKNAAEVEPLFTICSDCSNSSPDITRISISSSGTVAELRQGQDPQALPTPPGANSNSAMPTMNCYVLAANTNSSTCIEQ